MRLKASLNAIVLTRQATAVCLPLVLQSVLLIAMPLSAHASNYQIGASLGFGGIGVKTTQTLDGANVDVERSESPGVFSIFADYFLSDEYSLGAEHLRGFRLGPASSGASLTGVVGRWYFLGPASALPADNAATVKLLIKRYVPYVALRTGIISASLIRELDQIREANGSGFYAGIKLGADYQFAPGKGIRYEISSATTLITQSGSPTTLTEFGVLAGLFVIY